MHSSTILSAIVLTFLLLLAGCNDPQTIPEDMTPVTAPEPTPREAFKVYLDRQAAQQYVVSYQGDNATITYYTNGTHGMRIDIDMDSVSQRYYLFRDTGYICTRSASWSCLPTEQRINTIPSNLSSYSIQHAEPMFFGDTPSDCFHLTDNVTQRTYCFMPEGIPVYIHTFNSTHDQELTATFYRSALEPYDLTLPLS